MTPDPWTGLPPDPTVSGWHWLRGRDLETPEVAEWSELSQTWAWSGVSGTDTPAEIAERTVYVGPCDPNAAAEIERLRARIVELDTALHRIVDAPNLDVMTAWAIAHGALGDGA